MAEAIGGVRAAFMRMLDAHVALLRAELSIAGTQLGIIVGLALGAFVIAVLVAILLYVGSFLFFGELLFGSMGWGIIHGTLLGVAFVGFVVVNLAGGDVRTYGWGALIGVIVTVVLAALLLSNVGNEAGQWGARLFEQNVHEGSVDIGPEWVAGLVGFVVLGIVGAILAAIAVKIIERITDQPFGFSRPLVALGLVAGGIIGVVVVPEFFEGVTLSFGEEWVVTITGLVVVGLIGAVIAAIAGWRGGLRDQPLVGAVIGGLALGGFVGAVYASTRYQAVDGVLGLAIMVGLITWIAAGLALAYRAGFDPEARYADLVPRESIESFKQTKEFLVQQWERQKARFLGR